MAEEAKYEKGDRAAIVSGKQDVGVRGSVFWIGPNKWGPGMRYGLRGDDGATYWVDESNLGDEEGAPPAPEVEEVEEREKLGKGDRVKIVKGREGVGKEGSIFWVGESRYGKGMRYGVKGDDEATYWADGTEVEKTEGAAPAPAASKGDGGGGFDASEFDDSGYDAPPAAPAPMQDDAAWPGDDDYAEPEGAAEVGEEDIPF